MLCPDLIILISEYMIDTNYYLLNGSLYESIIMIEKSAYWKDKYTDFLKSLNKEYSILNGSYNWKREYMRVIKFEKWWIIDNSE